MQNYMTKSKTLHIGLDQSVVAIAICVMHVHNFPM